MGFVEIKARHASWQMYGFNLLVQMAMERGSFVDEDRWTRALPLLYACIPFEKKEEIDETLKNETDDQWWKAGTEIFTKLIGNTATLGFGWAVHTFLL